MIRSLALGLVLAMSATMGKLPSGEAAAQEPSPVAVVQVQRPDNAPAIVSPSTKQTIRIKFLPEQQHAQDTPNVTIVPSAENPRVVCGLTMWQVDPETDPKIRPSVSPPQGQKPTSISQPDFKIRRIVPTICRE
jgi:hypothetical protein